jgi:hypothetical protein
MLHHIEMIRSRVEGMFGPGRDGAATDALSHAIQGSEEGADEVRWLAVSGASG